MKTDKLTEAYGMQSDSVATLTVKWHCKALHVIKACYYLYQQWLVTVYKEQSAEYAFLSTQCF